MKLLGLDISTKTGFSICEPFQILAKGLIESKVEGDFESPTYPFNYIDMAKRTATMAVGLVHKFQPDAIIIEETNKGRNRYSQKQLEFIHFAVADAIRSAEIKIPIKYLDTSEWRKLIQLEYGEEDRAHNKEHSKQRHDKKKLLMEEVRACFQPLMHEELSTIESKRDRKRYEKAYHEMIQDIVRESMGKFKVRIDGKVAGKVSKKDLSVELVNRVFHTNFKGRDNDICDSVCLCLGYYESIGMENAWREITHTKS